MSGTLFELWDQESGNCTGDYDDQAAALADVRDTIARYGEVEALSLGLLVVQSDGKRALIADGEALVALARDYVTAPTFLGVGLYSLPEAARLLRAGIADLRRWLGLETYYSRGKKYVRVAFVHRELAGRDDLVTFRELMELRVIRALRRGGE